MSFVPGDLPLILATVLWLVFLEGLLSADNALVLAMLVRHLPKTQQKRALRYGMGGAVLFRCIAVLLAKMLLDFWFLKVVGGLYLGYLAASHFLRRSGQEDADSKLKRFGATFWGTVISVELADIAFSIDSILAAVGTASKLPADRVGPNEKFFIVVTGGILGIITMRFVAGYFILLLERFRGLEPGAYGLVAWIGLNLIVGGLHDAKVVPGEMNDWIFWIGMLTILGMGFLYQPKSPPTPADTLELAQSLSRGGKDTDDSDEEHPGPSGLGSGESAAPPAAKLPVRPGGV